MTAVLASGLTTREAVENVLACSPTPESAEELASALVTAGILTRFQAQRLLAGKPNGLVLGPYEILEPVGNDPEGRVFRARHRTMNRLAAVEILPTEFTSDPHRLASFTEDLRAAARLGHPNIVTLYDFNRFGDRHYLVLEYLEAIAADVFVTQNGLLPVGTACEIVRQAVLGLQHAHERGIAHGSLRPDCLQIGRGVRGLEVKVANFGFGRHGATEHTAGKAAGGPSDYRAPEQAVPTIAADLYSLGCILHFLLTGRPRVEAVHPAHLPLPLVRLIQNLQAVDPGERPSSVRDVADIVEPFATGDSSGKIEFEPRIVSGAVTVAGCILSGLVPHPGDRNTNATSPTDDSSPWAGVADSTLVDVGHAARIEAFELPPAVPRPRPGPLAALSTFVILGMAATITITTVLVAWVLLRHFTG